MKNIISFSLTVFFIAFYSASFCVPISSPKGLSSQKYYYVDGTNGRDSNDGLSINSAFKTIEKAKSTVKNLCSNMTSDITVLIAGETYHLKSTLLFTPQESGTNGYKVVYRNYNDNKPVISGAEVIKVRWKNDTGNIKKTFIGKGRVFRQLYVNDNKAVRSRIPNIGELSILPTVKENNVSPADSSQTGLYIEGDFIKQPIRKDEIEISVFIEWMNKRFRIGRLEKDSIGIKAVINAYEWECLKNGAQALRKYHEHRQYFLENAYEFIDSPGEWYYDKLTGYLYYYPLPGEDLTTAKIAIPGTEELIKLAGTIDKSVGNIAFSGLQFSGTAWNYPSFFGLIDVQGNTIVPNTASRINPDYQYRHNYKKDRVSAAFSVNYSYNILIDNCKFENLGGNGITITEGGENISVTNNVFRNISSSGIEIGNTAYFPKDLRMMPKKIIIFNNRLNKIATEYCGGVGIISLYVDELLVAHNDIEDLPYCGISVGWGWGANDNNISKHSIVRNNFIHNANKILRDGGFIYTLNSHANSFVVENYIKTDKYSPGRGIYHDESSAGFITQNNVIEGQYGKNLNLWQYSIHDIILKNIFIDKALPGIENQIVNNGKNCPFINIYERDSENESWPEQAKSIIKNAGYKPGLPTPQIPVADCERLIFYHSTDKKSIDDCKLIEDSTVKGYNGSKVVKNVGSAIFRPGLKRGYYLVSVYKPDFGVFYHSNKDEIEEKFEIKIFINSRKYSTWPWNVTNGETDCFKKVINFKQVLPFGGWICAGVFYFDGTNENYIELSGSTASYTYTNAVKFEKFTFKPEEGLPEYSDFPESVVIKHNGSDKILIDNAYPKDNYSEEGDWENSGNAVFNGFTIKNYSWDELGFRMGKNGAKARFTPNIIAEGKYKVYLYNNRIFKNDQIFLPKQQKQVKSENKGIILIKHADGTDFKTIDFKQGIEGWELLGSFSFSEGKNGFVEVSNPNNDKDNQTFIYADAVYFERIAE